jgi:hypothetical protein
MLFVLVPERNGVIVARAHAKPPHVCNGKSCLFQSNKVNFFFFFDNVRNMLRILHLIKYSNFDFIKFLKLNETICI